MRGISFGVGGAVSVVLIVGLLIGSAAAAPKSQAVMFAGNYPGGETFDDFLQPSAQALATNMNRWNNWQIAGANQNINILPGTNPGGMGNDAARFVDAIRPFQSTGATPMNAGDYFFLFYFGHGTYGFRRNTVPGEQFPATTVWDEALSFPDHSAVTDDELKAEFAKFNPGVAKVFVNISCFSGGFWNGNDLVTAGAGDLERLAGTALLASSPEHQVTYAGGLGPRPYEPLYLRNLIISAHPAFWGGISPTLAQWHGVSAVGGSFANANRFGDPWDDDPFDSEEGDPNVWWNDLVSGTADPFDYVVYDPDDTFANPWGIIPEPSTLALAAFAGVLLTRRTRRAASF